MREIDQRAVLAKSDEICLEELISDCESYILRTAYKVTGDYIDKSDDRWSVSLSAFYEAVLAYDYDKGSFFALAETVIRRRLYDYGKIQKRIWSETLVGSEAMNEFEGEPAAVESNAAWEIEAVGRIISEYGITFFDLASSSPKAAKTKATCARIVSFLLQNPIVLSEVWRTKTLPIKLLEKNLSITPKIVERHRKYIIVAVEVLNGDYPILAEYFRHMRKE